MTHIVYKAPLLWPRGRDITPILQRGYNNGFQTDIKMREAIAFLEDEVKQMAPEKATLHSDIDNINNERLRKRLSNDSAVCLEIKLQGETYYIACDRWHNAEHNIYAIHLSVRNFRNMERWGIANYKPLLSGLATDAIRATVAAATPKTGDLPEWMAMLGLGPTASLDDANAVYRRRAKLLIGKDDELIALNAAMDAARAALGKPDEFDETERRKGEAPPPDGVERRKR